MVFQELQILSQQAQEANRDRGYKYGRVGVYSNGKWLISEIGKRYITVTLETGTLLREVDSQGVSTAGAEVRLARIAGRWVIDGQDERSANLGASSASTVVPKHNHNVGFPEFYPVDPASLNDGLVLPTGNGLQVTIGRVTYPHLTGTLGIYDDNDTLDLASGVSGLSATTGRYAVIYIDRSDGSANVHYASAVSTPINVTTHIESAVADCVDTVSDAYPYYVVRLSVGLSSFSISDVAMAGRSVANKRFIRLGALSAGTSSTPSPGSSNIIAGSGSIIGTGQDAFFAGALTVTGGLTIEGGLTVLS